MKEENTDRMIEGLKSFISEQMKSEAAEWSRCTRSEIRVSSTRRLYESRYLTIFYDGDRKAHIIGLKEGRSYEKRFELKDFGMSRIRFWFLVRRVKSLCDRKEELDKKRLIASQWKSFLDENKQLSRDINIGKILED